MTLADDSANSGWGLYPRPTEVLHDLPMRLRWEVSRRHPYYLDYWKLARDFEIGGRCGEDGVAALGTLASAMMLLIGVTGTPVDPALEFEQLDETSPDPAFLSGAVQPMTYRNIVKHLIGALSPAAAGTIGSVLQVASHRDYAVDGDSPNQDRQRAKALAYLSQIHDKVLDSYFDGPLVYIHLGASQRTILEATEQLVGRWKRERGIPEKRIHTSKLDDELRTWDLREGWAGGAYDLALEKPFGAISRELKLPKSTVVNRYKSAFKRITGQDFTFARWVQLIAEHKLQGVDLKELPRVHQRRWNRLLQATTAAPVPESTLSRDVDKFGEGVASSKSVTENPFRSSRHGVKAVHGEVAALDGTDAFVRIGADSGVAIGEVVDILRNQGEVIDPQTEAILGERRIRVGKAQIIDVQPKLSRIRVAEESIVELRLGDLVTPSKSQEA